MTVGTAEGATAIAAPAAGAGMAVDTDAKPSTAADDVDASTAHADMTGEGTVVDGDAGVRATAVEFGRALGDATDDRDGGGERPQ